MQVNLYSDEELLAGCKKNKRHYQEILYRKYARKMYGLCMSYAPERDMAQDILQDAFIKVFNKIKDFKKDGSLEGWIRKIIVNTALDHLRKQTREYRYVVDNDGDKEDECNPDAIENLKTEDVLKMVAELPEGARMVFNLHVLEGYTHKEIAEKMNITEGTSKSQFNRARKKLMILLNKFSA